MAEVDRDRQNHRDRDPDRHAERPAREVAATLEMSLNAVYIAKHRSIQRLRTIMAELQEAF